MVIRLVFPKSANSSKNLVGCVSGASFQFLHNVPQRNSRKNHHVDVVSHDDPSGELIELLRKRDNLLPNQACDTSISQPNRPSRRPVSLVITKCKDLPVSEPPSPGQARLRTRQSPGDKDPSVRRQPVRQLANIRLIHPITKCPKPGASLIISWVTGFSLSSATDRLKPVTKDDK